MWDPRTNDLPPSKGITVLRIFLWGIPIFILYLGAAAVESFRNIWFLSVLVTILAITAIGYFDQRLALQQKRLDPAAELHRIVRGTLLFLVAQFFIIPLQSFVLFRFHQIISPFIP